MFLIDTYLGKSKIHGVGVFSKQNVKKGRKIKEVRPEFEIEFDQNNLPRMPLALANFIETHSFQKETIRGAEARCGVAFRDSERVEAEFFCSLRG